MAILQLEVTVSDNSQCPETSHLIKKLCLRVFLIIETHKIQISIVTDNKISPKDRALSIRKSSVTSMKAGL